MELLGQRFGHIRVTAIVGEGGMGEVYSGYDETLERRVALKVVHPELRLDTEARERLLREARALSKLDHPNICRIHDYIENGDPDLLVLEYIDGRTLTDFIGEKRTRAEKLRIAIAIAEVLVAAHRAEILHRDLKPDNVMLTKSGDVKVLDFGLARWLHRGRSSPVVREDEPSDLISTARHPQSPSRRREFVRTQAGITMGTPMFMSPEQARGEKLTAASDMFALGLVLQVLFTGLEPHPDTMSSREVILRVAAGTTNPVQGVAGDIAALINRLKQFAPADRPTAVEALARLRYLANKPVRMIRRGIAAAIALVMAIGVWRYTVDLQRERAAAIAAERIAVAERAEAVRRRGQAEDLIDFMMGDLHRKLARIGHLDALDAAADRAMAYMSSLSPETMSPEELARNTVALDHLGQVRMAQGKLPEALHAFEQSLLIGKKAAAKAPRNPEIRFALGQAQFWVGEAHRQMGNRIAALANMREYLATSEALARAEPRNLDYQIELAYGFSNIGSLLEAEGDFAGALQHYERCVAVKRARLRTDPANREWQGDLAQTIDKIGSTLLAEGRLVEAEQRFAEEQAIYLSLVIADPTNAPWKMRLVTSRAYLGLLMINLGDLDRAAKQFQAAETMAGELVAFDSANVGWRRALAVVLANRADVMRMQGHIGEANARAARAESLMKEVVREAPQNTAWRRDLTYVTLQHAKTLYAAGDNAAAKNRAEIVVAAHAPENRDSRAQTAEAMLLLADVAAAQRRMADARDFRNRVVMLAASAPPAPPDIRLLDRHARALMLLGRDREATPIIDELRRLRYAHPDLVRLPVGGAKS